MARRPMLTSWVRDRSSKTVNISFLHGDVAEPVSVPGQILMFVDFCNNNIPLMDSVDGYISPGTYAVVRCLDGEPTPLKDSVLLMTGQRHDKLTLVCIEHFHEPICIINNIGCQKKSVFVVHPHADWAEEFC
jgi:hypothetical protein